MTTPESTPTPSPLQDILRERIRTHGPITFAEFMGQALYHPEHGYYRGNARKPGRGGDFLTSPELHPFFGFTLARQVAEVWDALDQPHRLVVREHGASSGGLAADILIALRERAPDVLDAIDYRLIDVNAHRLEDAMAGLHHAGLSDHVSIEAPGDRPVEDGLVLANEVADALPVHRLVVHGGQLRERMVGVAADGTFTDAVADLSAPVAALDLPAYLARHGIALPDGAAIEVAPDATDWMRGIGRALGRGMAVIIDYGYDAPTLYQGHRLQGTLRAHHLHTVSDDPYPRVGEQDLTAHVDFTRLIEAVPDMRLLGLTTQADYLIRMGLGEWLVDLQRQPGISMQEYYEAQGATMRLIDPAGFGRFRVLGLAKGLPDAFAARGFADLSVAQDLASLPDI